MKEKYGYLIICIFGMLFLTVLVIPKLFAEKESNIYINQFNGAEAGSSAAGDVVTTVRITVTKSKTASKPVTKTTCTTTSAKTDETEKLWININTADAEELCRLKGIGKVISEKIVSYREENGCFRNIEEIMLVDGIGEGIFSDICGCIYVENPIYPTTSAIEETEIETLETVADENIQEITEPTTEQTEPTEEAAVMSVEFPININTADIEELMCIPEMDEKTAIDILELRSKIGSFSNYNELVLLKNADRRKIRKILEYLVFE